MANEYDAELRDWTKMSTFFIGFIFNDSKGRFEDDTPIRTSLTVSVSDDNILTTLNTKYKLSDQET